MNRDRKMLSQLTSIINGVRLGGATESQMFAGWDSLSITQWRRLFAGSS